MSDYLLRNVPEDMHKEWAHFARKQGKTMKTYLLIALKQKIEKDKN